MDRVTKSRPITPKTRLSYGSINSIIFSKRFLARPPPSPPPHACNFYINFKPLSCIKLFCGRERCVWGGGAAGLSGSAGGLRAPGGRGTQLSATPSPLPPTGPWDRVRRMPQAPHHVAAPGPAGVPARGPPRPAPALASADHPPLQPTPIPTSGLVLSLQVHSGYLTSLAL